jgi:hypothetical protein
MEVSKLCRVDLSARGMWRTRITSYISCALSRGWIFVRLQTKDPAGRTCKEMGASNFLPCKRAIQKDFDFLPWGKSGCGPTLFQSTRRKHAASSSVHLPFVAFVALVTQFITAHNAPRLFHQPVLVFLASLAQSIVIVSLHFPLHPSVTVFLDFVEPIGRESHAFIPSFINRSFYS